MKHGITATQITPYTILVVVLAVVMVFGFRAISGTADTQEQIFITALKQQLENDFDNIQFGDQLVREYKIPGEFFGICFADDNPIDGPTCPGTCSVDPKYSVAEDATSGDVQDNVFLVGTGAPETDYLAKLAVACCPVVCFDSDNGRVKITIEGTGQTALISP